MNKVIVIGGGPAGMMSAITARKNGDEVILLEGMRTVGRKLSITGKGRCNITNNAPIEDFFKNIPRNSKFLYSAFYGYTNEDLISDLTKMKIKTKVERGQRVFPVSDSALDVINKFKEEMDKLGVKVIVNSKVTNIIVENNKAVGVETKDGKYYGDKIILATGGKSYPNTGSDGSGYILASNLGHTIIPPKASLVPIETFEKNEMQGLSLKNVLITVKDGSKKIYEDFGEMLFTHFGLSGPIILSASSYILRLKDLESKLKKREITIHIDLKPALSLEKLDDRVQRDFEEHSRKQFKNCLDDLLPAKIIPYIVKLSNINDSKQIDQITKEERLQLVNLLKDLVFTVKKLRPIDEAIVTAGGIDVKEVNPSTMESKIVKNLFFAGEILDVDAYTGGFNLQIAFSTGHLAGSMSKDVE